MNLQQSSKRQVFFPEQKPLRTFSAGRPFSRWAPSLLMALLLATNAKSQSPGVQRTEPLPEVVGLLVVHLIDQVEVPALKPGPISSIAVGLGDSVSQGAPIAQIDDRDSANKRHLAATDVDISTRKSEDYRNDKIANTEWSEKRAALEQQKLSAKIASEKAGNEVRISAAEKAEAVAKNEWMRASNARKRFADSISESELESLRLKYERAGLERVQASFEHSLDLLTSQSEQQGVKAAELAVERAEIANGVAESDKEILHLDLISKKQTLTIRELEVAQHRVSSPIDGIVVELYKQTGEWVMPGESVARVINLDHLHAEGFLSGDIVPQRGQAVSLYVGSKSVEGVVDFVSQERNRVSGELRFLVRFPGGVFQPGDRVEIKW